MNKTIAFYYLVVLCIVVGAFASMAQNDYGITMMGYACIALVISFTNSLIKVIRFEGINKRTLLSIIELVSLIVISSIFSFRVFLIQIPFAEIAFTLSGLLLIIRFTYLIAEIFKTTWNENRILCVFSSFFYLSIIFYTASMVIVIIDPRLSEPLGGTGFALLLLYLAGGLYFRNLFYKGEKFSVLNYLNRFSTKSILMISIYLLFTFYMGLSKFDLIPNLYTGEFPQAYIHLINQAEMGEENPVNGKFKHERFKENYDVFVNEHLQNQD